MDGRSRGRVSSGAMPPAQDPQNSMGRTWLVLGRVSNLPTVWSNCLAAWLLGGGGMSWRLGILCAAGTLVYVAGMFLNDAFDAGFDREHRSERPIPSGRVSAQAVWIAGWSTLIAGWIGFAALGPTTALLGLLLAISVVVYDSVHKRSPLAPLLMGLCRYLLFVAAGSASIDGVLGETVWSGLVLGGYVVGLSCVASGESRTAPVQGWALGLLALPIILAGLVNPPHVWTRANVAGPLLLLILWSARSVAEMFKPGGGGARATVSGLLAGIVLVDLLALAPAPWPGGVVFLGLFATAWLLQRVVPAT